MPSSHLINPRQNDRFGYCEDPTRALTSELPPITDMVLPRGKRFRLPLSRCAQHIRGFDETLITATPLGP